MKKYFLNILASFLFCFFVASFFIKIGYAQETPETKTKKYGVTFPVTELGNCASVSECRTYCEDQTHKDACVTFAKKKGFYQETEIDPKRETLMQAAKTELGCSSEQSCKEMCRLETNFEKCRAFAEKNGLESGPKNPGDKKIMEKAKEILGCDSPESCKAICEQEANREKCSEFAKQTGLEGGKKRVGPGGCNSEDSCKEYCEKNPEECKKFGGGPSSEDKNRKGPGGCDSEESCKKYCDEHPDECKNENREKGKDNGPREGKFAQPGPGGCDSEESCKKYCEEHPNECGNKDRQNNPGIEQRNGPPPEDYCRTHPDECRRKEMKIEDRQPNENRPSPPEDRRGEDKLPEINPANEGERPPGEEVKGISTEISFFTHIMNYLLGK